MNISSSQVPTSAPRPLLWVESMGGPLIAVPVSALSRWGGCTGSGTIAGSGDLVDDYDRACEVDDLAGVTAVGANGAHALLLADEPATAWAECGTWEADGPAILMDSAEAGDDLNVEYAGGGGLPEHAPVPMPPGRWRVRAVHTRADDRTSVGLVQFVPALS
ncbi:Imm21 family immunity protein [Streptomyces sp. NPDC005141]